MKKRFLIIFSIIILSLALISCNKDISPPSIDSNESKTDASKPNPSESEVINNKEDDKIKDEISNNEAINIDDTNNDQVSSNDSTTENRSVRLYFYDVVTDNIVYYDDVIEVTDKAVTTALINALKYPTNQSVTPSIPENIGVSSAKLDEANNTFTVDFPANLVTEMNLGSGPESSTLKSIVNTIGYNFGVDNVIITLGGKPYSSGHIALSEGESFKVSLDYTIQLN